jgi:hypothetical protein
MRTDHIANPNSGYPDPKLVTDNMVLPLMYRTAEFHDHPDLGLNALNAVLRPAAPI